MPLALKAHTDISTIPEPQAPIPCSLDTEGGTSKATLIKASYAITKLEGEIPKARLMKVHPVLLSLRVFPIALWIWRFSLPVPYLLNPKSEASKSAIIKALLGYVYLWLILFKHSVMFRE